MKIMKIKDKRSFLGTTMNGKNHKTSLVTYYFHHIQFINYVLYLAICLFVHIQQGGNDHKLKNHHTNSLLFCSAWSPHSAQIPRLQWLEYHQYTHHIRQSKLFTSSSQSPLNANSNTSVLPPTTTSSSTNHHPRYNSYGNNNATTNNNHKSSNWLEIATNDILDKSRIPLGQLTNDDVESIGGLMANWAKRKTSHSALQVERLLKRVVDDNNHGNNQVHVTTRMYTMAIDAWAKTGGWSSAHRAHVIHSSMVEMYKRTGDTFIQPSTISYNAVINAWSKCMNTLEYTNNFPYDSGMSHDDDRVHGGSGYRMMEEQFDHVNSNRYKSVTDENDDDDSVDYDDYNTVSSMNDSTTQPKYTKDDEIHSNNNYKSGSYAAGKAEEILEEMLYEWKQLGIETVKPDVVSFTSVIDSWAKSGSSDGASRAMKLLKRMQELYLEESELSMKPNVYTYSACINAFAKSQDPDAPNQAEALLDEMKRSYEAGDMEVKPNVVNYNSVINAWGRCKSRGSAVRAAEILNLMEADDVEPDGLSYALVVSAWSHSSEPYATKQAEVYLQRMEDWAMEKNAAIDKAFDLAVRSGQAPPSLPSIRVHLDVECYNTVLISLSRRQEVDGPERAIAIVNRMKYLAEKEGFETVRPNARSWNSVLNTISRSRLSNAAQRAEEVLNEMYQDGVKPDVFSFAAILHAYQKNSGPQSAQRADDIVRMMEKLYYDGEISSSPDVYHYTIVCSCWARSGEPIAAQRCGQILRHMEDRYKNGHNNCKPNTRTYNAVIDAYARSHDVDTAEQLLASMIGQYKAGDMKVKPDGFTFNAVINAWTRSRRSDCGEKAEIVLQKLLQFHNDGNPDVKPDSRSFSHIIDYYARGGREPDAAQRAESLLITMINMYKDGYKEVLPNIFCFTAVIQAFVKQGRSDCGRSAERVLQYLTDLHVNYNLQKLSPNTYILNSVLHAWSKSGDEIAAERAEQIVLYMEEQHRRLGKFEVKTNTRSYGLVLASWAKSRNPQKALRAKKILYLMDKVRRGNDNVHKNVHCYNAVLNAAAFTEGNIDERTDAFEVATQVLEDLLSSKVVKPISSSFGTYLKACGKLSLPKSMVEPYIEMAFSECKKLGLVNDFVLTQMRYSTSTEQYQVLLGKLSLDKNLNDKVVMSEIPLSWKRNVETDEERAEWWKIAEDQR